MIVASDGTPTDETNRSVRKPIVDDCLHPLTMSPQTSRKTKKNVSFCAHKLVEAEHGGHDESEMSSHHGGSDDQGLLVDTHLVESFKLLPGDIRYMLWYTEKDLKNIMMDYRDERVQALLSRR
jgi:hypothetical protein